MTLTKCPHCGQTVLSVASQCPACAGALSSAFLGAEPGELAQCRSCGHPVHTTTHACPHCGVRRPAPHRKRMTALRALAALGLAAGTTLALARILPDEDRSAGETGASQGAEYAGAPHGPDAAVTPPLAATAPAVADVPPPVESEQALGLAAPLAETHASDPARRPAGAAAPDTSAAGARTRWTRVWANVRRQPDTQSPIVGVLAPGAEVQGVRGQWGWWAIQLGDDSVGYIAGELLTSSRPQDSRPPRL